jgi:hypothetical protein
LDVIVTESLHLSVTVDAVVMTESALVEEQEACRSADTITIKVQTSTESMKYNLALVSDVQRGMC